MAQSRLEKIGTIYSRMRGLLQSGAVEFNDRPIWYDIYEAFPPKDEPRFDRPVPNLPVKAIFYPEDKIRADLHKKLKTVGTVNLLNSKTPSFTQRYLQTYRKIEELYGENVPDCEKVHEEALNLLKAEREAHLNEQKAYEVQEETEESFSSAFKLAPTSKHKAEAINIQVKDIFKE